MSFIRPRMYGSTDIHSFCTRNSPSTSGSMNPTPIRKLSSVGTPLGRDLSSIWRDDLAGINGNIQQLAGVIQKKTGKAREEIDDFLRSVSHTTSTTVERISEAASDMATKASETLRDGYDYAREASRDGIKNASETVQHRPGESMLLAMGIGLVAGLIIGSSMFGRRNY